MEEGTICGTYLFRGIEYVVTMTIGSGSLTMEVEDRLTADQWRGTFDSKYVEDLTHKTGNFKQFKIFISMLESALNGSSEAVSLDLLTYSDLESLRNRKAGLSTKAASGARPAALNTKRYLILTYTVQFDRIHYPLPLPFMGKPDPRGLQETIRELRQEIKELKQTNSQTYQNKEMAKLQRDFNELLQEKNELEAEFVEYKREIQHTSKGSAAKEVRILKGIVKNLEEELVEEKARYQRSANKRNQECRKLQDEVDELRASERNLKVRVKSLVNELAVHKGRRSANSSISSRTHRNSFERSNLSRDNSRLSYASNRSNSTERSKTRTSLVDRQKKRPSSTERARQYSREQQRNRSSSREHQRNRSTSRDRFSEGRVYMRDRSNSWGDRASIRSNSRDRGRSSSQERSRPNSRSNSIDRFRSRTPSPRPKFDPTAFVRERDRRRKEADLKKRRQTRKKMNGSVERKSPSPLSENPYSRNSSFGSGTSGDYLTDTGAASEASLGSRRARGKSTTSNGCTASSPEDSFSRPRRMDAPKKVLASTPDSVRHKAFTSGKENFPSESLDSEYYERPNEISEIDARLGRLQEFMKAAMP